MIRKLRRDDDLHTYEAIGLRAEQGRWNIWFENLKNIGISKTNVKGATNGFVLFCDENTAIAAKLSDTLKFTCKINFLCVHISEILGVELSEL